MLDDRIAWVMEAFWQLGTGRRIGFGAGGIAFADIEAYCRLAEVYDRPLFVRQITRLDAAYLQWQAKRAKAQDSKTRRK